MSKGESEKALSDVLAALSSKPEMAGKTASVLLLARYRYLEPDLQDLRRRFPRLTFSFKTIHASKGLEADHVVLLNADSGRVGFPSEIVDDPLLGLVSPAEETFQNAEERRVMYVAMTRARRTLTILASNARPSAFVTELVKDPAYGIVQPPSPDQDVHECGECGGRLLSVQGQDGRTWYRCEHSEHCGNFLPACFECGASLPRRVKGVPQAQCTCGKVHTSCPECTDGWLVERTGPHSTFLGCVRYPTCIGKAQLPREPSGRSSAVKRRR